MPRTVKLTRLVKRPKHTIRPKRIDTGLYHGKTIVFGNQNTFSEKKTRRAFKPNVQWVRLYSEALDERMRIKVTTKALRCIEKAGGLDNYLLNTKEKDIDSAFGFWLKDKIVKQREQNMQKKYHEEDVDIIAHRLADHFEQHPEEYKQALTEEEEIQRTNLEAHMARMNLSNENESVLENDPDTPLYKIKKELIDPGLQAQESSIKRFVKIVNRPARPKYSKKDPYYTLETWMKPEQVTAVHEQSAKDKARIEKIVEVRQKNNRPELDW